MTYPDVDNLKTELAITASGDDSKLTLYIDEAIAFLEAHTGRVFVATTATKTFPVDRRHSDGSKRLIWTYEEMVTVTALVIDGTTIPTAEYYLSSWDSNPPFLIIVIREGSVYRVVDSDGLTDISVTGTWGYSVACPDDLFMALISYAVWRYRAQTTGTPASIGQQSKRGGQTIDVRAIPADVLDVFNNYIRG